MRSTVPCSSTPARTRAITYSSAAILEDHRVDALQVQQVTEHQTGRARPDDGHLGAEASHLRQLYQGFIGRHSDSSWA